jgi:hypothetical protein
MESKLEIIIAVEDIISEYVLRKIIGKNPDLEIGACIRKNGNSYLRSKLDGLNHTAKSRYCIVLTDLDQYSCPPELMENWFTGTKNPKLLFRVAVREVESWLLADTDHLLRYLHIRRFPSVTDSDAIQDPKQFLMSIAKHSTEKSIREGVPRSESSAATIGPAYNLILSNFVNTQWDVESAALKSESLRRTIQALMNIRSDN